MRILDISVPIRDGMVVWPGQDRFESHRTSQIARGEVCNLRQMSIGTHVGTHVDAPNHFLDDGATIDQIDLEAFVGPCRVVAIENPSAIERADLEPHALDGVERLLLKTANSALHASPTFFEDFIALSPEAARYLAGIESLRLVGLDYHSIAPFDTHESVQVHHAILGRSIVALEGLNLSGVEPGEYELIALPLRLEGCDGSPVRAVLIDRDG
jgi:arylformamidase